MTHSTESSVVQVGIVVCWQGRRASPDPKSGSNDVQMWEKP